MAEGKTVDPALRKNLIIIGGVLIFGAILVAIVIMLRGPAKNASAQTANLPKTTGAGLEKDQPMSPAMAELLREKQLAEAEEARRKNKSYIPPDSDAAVPIVPAAERQAYEPPPPQSYAVYPSAPPPAQSQLGTQGNNEEDQRYSRMRKGLENQLRDLLAANAPPQNAPQRVTGATVAAAASGVAPANGRIQAEPITVVDALEIFGGATASPIDTYKTGYVSAKITSGRLAGAFLTGRTVLVNEGLQPKFTAMRFNGRSYKIDAIALDEKTATDAVDATLDRRYLQRYVMPVLMAAAGGYASARASTGSSVVGLGIGGTGVAQPAPTQRQAENAGIAAALSIAQQAAAAEASKPIRATLEANAPIGVMFLAPVLDTDSGNQALQAAAGAFGAERTQAAQAGPDRGPVYGQPQASPQPGFGGQVGGFGTGTVSGVPQQVITQPPAPVVYPVLTPTLPGQR